MTGVRVHNIKFTKNKKKMGRRKVCHNKVLTSALKDRGSLELGQLA